MAAVGVSSICFSIIVGTDESGAATVAFHGFLIPVGYFVYAMVRGGHPRWTVLSACQPPESGRTPRS